MFKSILTVAAFGAAVVAPPAIAAPEIHSGAGHAAVKKVKPAPPVKKPASEDYGLIPAAILLSGVFIITVANRRRNLQKVLD